MTRKTLLILSCILFFAFCKKKDGDPEPSPTPVTTGTLPSLNTDNGMFTSFYNEIKWPNLPTYTDSLVQATFFISPGSYNAHINAGTVSVNTTTLNLTVNNIYTTSIPINLKNLNWQVNGNGTISACSFSYSPLYPSYNGANSLPDTLIKANGMSFDLNGLTNGNSSVVFSVGQGSISVSKMITSVPSTISLSAAESGSFLTNADFTIRLSAINYSSVTLNGNKYGINAGRTYLKVCYLK
ncbi:MAG: hypothetical protein V4635_00615 [Bacteroidota bacterium]